MRKFDQITEDYSRQPVPDSATVTGLRITVVMVGAVITLPIFFVAAQLGHSLGLRNAIIAFFVAGVFLAGLAGAAGVLASKTRLTTWFILKYSFGGTGAKIVSGFIGITVLGWYGATVEMFARAVVAIVRDLGGTPMDNRVYLIIASILMIAIALFGFKGLDRLSRLALPIMLVLLGSLVYTAISTFGIPEQSVGEMPLSQGISATIGAFIVAVAMFPDVCRYARSSKDAVQASWLSFGLGVPIVLLLAAIPITLSGEQDFLKVILTIGLGVPGLVLLLLATWTTNAFNLYSSSLVFATIIERVQKWKLVIVVGILGTLVALLPILDNFLYFLNFLAALVPPLAGIYLSDYFVLNKQEYDAEDLKQLPAFRPVAFVAWILGSLVGLFANEGKIALTSVPAADAILTAFLIYTVLSYVLKNKKEDFL